MMRPCEKCLKNSWAFKVNDGVVHATCDNCGNSVEFKARDKAENKKEIRKKRFFQEGDKCGRRDRDCSGTLHWKEDNEITAKRLEKSYHYEKWLKCNKCGATFFDNKYKILHETDSNGSIRFRKAIN